MSIPRMHLLPLLLLAVACLSANAVTVPLGATEATGDQLTQACIGQGSKRVCYPLATGGRQFVQCGGQAPTVGECPRGTRFDYVKRACIRASYAQPCPTWYCPVIPAGAALSPIYGQFGVPGNLTIPLWKKETFTVYCPVNGHCLGGMVFYIHVDCPAPADRYPFTFELDWDEIVTNEQMFPKRQADLYAFCGDSVFIEWDEPIHLVQLFNTSAAAAPLWDGTLITPYPPQPVYQCPIWPAGPPEGFPIPFPDEAVIMPVAAGAQNATWTATVPETFFFACPLGNHCRLGMVFKVTVVAAPAGYTPVHSTIQWIITSDNYPDLTLNVGDSIMFVVPANPPMAHGVFKTPTSRIITL